MLNPKTLLFIYGTLKRGYVNHRLIANQCFLGRAQTAAGYTLYSLGDYPGLLDDPTDKNGVEGELWGVNAETLIKLDEFEGTEYGLYVRRPIILNNLNTDASDHNTPECYFYNRSIINCEHIGSNW